MLFKTHFVVALFVFLISFRFFENTFIYGLFFLFSTLFVDIDSKKSRMGKLVLFRPLQWFFPHRGVLHSLFFAVFISLFIFMFSIEAGYGFLLGYLVHLVLDCLSLSGVALFWPLSKKKIKGFVKTGGVIEDIVFVVFIFLSGFIVVKLIFDMLFSTI